MRYGIPLKVNKRNNKGFTLVELIVVLVILAILAALLVPALMGYIDRAKRHQYIENAKTIMTATQAQLAEEYAKSGGNVAPDTSVIPGALLQSRNGDSDARGTDFANKVLELSGFTGENEPYVYMIALGSNYQPTPQVTDKDKYTVLYGLYIDKADSPHIYFYNGEWTESNPRYNSANTILNGDNKFTSGPYKNKRIQYYLITNNNKSKPNFDGIFWSWIKSDK